VEEARGLKPFRQRVLTRVAAIVVDVIISRAEPRYS
jgi:hypothetical protein